MKYYECVFLFLPYVPDLQIEFFLHAVILSSVACLYLQYLSTLSHKGIIFGMKVIEHKIYILIFYTNLSKFFFSFQKNRRDIIITFT